MERLRFRRCTAQVLRNYRHHLQDLRSELEFSLDSCAPARFFAANPASKDLPGVLRLNLHQGTGRSTLADTQFPSGASTLNNPIAAGRPE